MASRLHPFYAPPMLKPGAEDYWSKPLKDARKARRTTAKADRDFDKMLRQAHKRQVTRETEAHKRLMDKKVVREFREKLNRENAVRSGRGLPMHGPKENPDAPMRKKKREPNKYLKKKPKPAPRPVAPKRKGPTSKAPRAGAAAGNQPPQSQLKQLAKLGKAARFASKAIPIAGTVATAYDVAQRLGGPPTKDPKKFKNYKHLVRRGYRAK